MLDELANRCELVGIKLIYNNEIAKHLAKNAQSENFGARELRREITKKIEDKLSNMIVEGKLKENDTVTLSVDKDNIVFKIMSQNTLCTSYAY